MRGEKNLSAGSVSSKHNILLAYFSLYFIRDYHKCITRERKRVAELIHHPIIHLSSRICHTHMLFNLIFFLCEKAQIIKDAGSVEDI